MTSATARSNAKQKELEKVAFEKSRAGLYEKWRKLCEEKADQGEFLKVGGTPAELARFTYLNF